MQRLPGVRFGTASNPDAPSKPDPQTPHIRHGNPDGAGPNGSRVPGRPGRA